MNGSAVSPATVDTIDTVSLRPGILDRARRDAADSDEYNKEFQEREEHYRSLLAKEERARTDDARETLAQITKAEEESDRIKEESERLLREGRPFKYIIDTFKLDHEGDLTAARCMALVFAASSVANGEGLHCYISGSSGKGKTHAAETMFRQLPSKYAYNLSFSDKFLFYAGDDPETGLEGGVVVLVDDQTMSDSVQAVFKVAVSHYREGTKYGTVINQKSKLLKVPARVSWVLLKVDDPGDDQVMNRLIQARIVESEEKIKDSARKIQQKYRDLKKKTISIKRREILVCREMWARIKALSVGVEVPCAGHVNFADYDNLRNHEIFFNLIMAHAVIHRWQRKEIGTTEDSIPIIVATKDDYDEARKIFEALYSLGGQRHNSLKNEDIVVDSIIKLNPPDGIFTLKQVSADSGLAYNTTYRAMKGRKDGKSMAMLGGLLAKCPYIQEGGKRGKFELETKMDTASNNDYSTEIVRKESYNEDIYYADIEGLKGWRDNKSPVSLAPGFRWE